MDTTQKTATGSRNAARELEKGQKYQWEKMDFLGWVTAEGDPANPDIVEGYFVGCYFDDDGAYLGPDIFGIEPILVAK